MAAGASTYSNKMAIAVMKPAKSPTATCANRWPPPAEGRAADSSARARHMPMYSTATIRRAQKRPPQPPEPSPNCQPAKSPEMTNDTPSPARTTQLKEPCFKRADGCVVVSSVAVIVRR